MKTSFYEHEQEVANGWDSTPTGGNDLITSYAVSMGYEPEVMDLISGIYSDEEYFEKYPHVKNIIKKMSDIRKKGRKSVNAMRDIMIANINKDQFANIFRKEGIDVQLYKDDKRSINVVSEHEPDFVMTKKTLFGKTSKNVKLHFTTEKMDGKYFIDTEKLIHYFQKNTIILIINTNTKQYGVIDTADSIKMVRYDEYKYKRRSKDGDTFGCIEYTPKRVALMSEGNMKPIINDLF